MYFCTSSFCIESKLVKKYFIVLSVSFNEMYLVLFELCIFKNLEPIRKTFVLQTQSQPHAWDLIAKIHSYSKYSVQNNQQCHQHLRVHHATSLRNQYWKQIRTMKKWKGSRRPRSVDSSFHFPPQKIPFQEMESSTINLGGLCCGIDASKWV